MVIRNKTIIFILTLVSVVISIIDIYWSIKNQDTLLKDELNPLGKFLIKSDDGDVALFMTVKAAGTMVVGFTIPIIYWLNNKWGLTIGLGVTSFQIVLFAYLYFGEHFPYVR